jgi:hypothetical protein
MDVFLTELFYGVAESGLSTWGSGSYVEGISAGMIVRRWGLYIAVSSAFWSSLGYRAGLSYLSA